MDVSLGDRPGTDPFTLRDRDLPYSRGLWTGGPVSPVLQDWSLWGDLVVGELLFGRDNQNKRRCRGCRVSCRRHLLF